MVYSTRQLPGSVQALGYSMSPPAEVFLTPLPHEPAHSGLGTVSLPKTAVHSLLFADAANNNGIDEAWLRAIAHAESNFRSDAISPKGAAGIMQLMPATAAEYRVTDRFSPSQSIHAGAKYLAMLLRRYKGDRRLAAAAYNAGMGAVARHRGVPPYAETLTYVDKVDALYRLYMAALKAGAEAR